MESRPRRDIKSKLEKLAEYKRAREGGKRASKEDDEDLYDVVTEDQYHGIVKGRLAKDDFIVDDGVGGYTDNGMDDWTGGDYDSEQEEAETSTKKSKTRNGKSDSRKPKPNGKPRAPPQVEPPSINAYRPIVSAEKEDDLMSSILGTMDSSAIATSLRTRKRKPSPEFSPPRSPARKQRNYRKAQSPEPLMDHSSDGFDVPATSDFDDEQTSPKKKVKVSDARMAPTVEKMSNLGVQSGSETGDDYSDVDMDAFMDTDDLELEDIKPVEKKQPAVVNRASSSKLPEKKPQKTRKETGPPAWLSVHDSLNVKNEDSFGPQAKAAKTSSTVSALELDGSLRFFWLDYLEYEGKIYFTGKLKDKESGTWVSCCVTVENLERNLFILPRERRVEQDEEGEIYETDIIPKPEDVHEDFDRIRKTFNIKSWKGKFVKRKYAFGETDAPRGEAQWMKVVYGFNEPAIPREAVSPSIARIFGSNTSAFELLVIKRKIMGPCWLHVKNPQVDNKGVSWCKLEVTVSGPKDINPFTESEGDAPKDTPPLNVMSLSVRTIVNHKQNKREIVCVTVRVWRNLQIEDATPPEHLPCSAHTFVRPLGQFPPGFEAQAKSVSKGSIAPVANERMLLNTLLVTIYKSDPDVIVGHDFLGDSLDVLLHRMKELKPEHWSRIGRFRRSAWPNIGRQGSNLKFLNGRLLCDLASDGAKGMISSTTWSLTEMCQSYLKMERQDIDPDDTASYFDGSVSKPERLMTFVRHCELDAHCQMAIAAKVQILPLTRQLTNLAGNSWNKTLNGGRAERNEYILLHEFHRLKYVCPDKFWGKRPAAIKDDDEEAGTKTKGKKDKYKGGLVFDPKRGLWDTFILVMDFNSLYPSIIQEFNIDFTTVDKVDDVDGEEQIPEVPSPAESQGVLPRLIATLVNRRKQVKGLMKDRSVPPAKLMQYDIKQQALKLTANSMYGCLGFENSRFYARPLAALTTYKGREILTATRELAESMKLDVVYGDTDSVFVNSGATELAEALKISAEFKKEVNDRYKLLEIDLDSVFKRLLLLQKKKYAAVKIEDGGTRTSIEVKGLDMKRREYSVLSKNVSQFVLDQILSGEPTEVVVENIHEYLGALGENVRNGKIKLEEFIIYKRLGKNPEDYPDAKSQPHVQVGLRMKAKGGSARAGDVVPYVFCISEGEESARSAQADRAKHPDEFRRANGEIKLDYEFYLSQQVLPPIERLCEHIEGTSRQRLAEFLGLDTERYKDVSNNSEARTFSTLDSLVADSEKFKDATPFRVKCRNCKGEMEYKPLYDRESTMRGAGPTCSECGSILATPSLLVQLEVQIREHINRYYQHWTVCNDPTCKFETRMMGVYGKRCLRKGCLGTVSFKYTDEMMYNQLRYYASLFSCESAMKSARGESAKMTIRGVASTNAECLEALHGTANKFLERCGRRWVDLGSIFSFMKV